MIQEYIDKLAAKQDLAEEESFNCLNKILSGKSVTKEIKQLLLNLNEKGEAISEIVGFAKAMRAYMLTVDLEGDVIDICGTGGTQKERFNVSTAAAFILAADGIKVAKHGNRGSRKPNGSFDFLENLGINFNHSVARIETLFNETDLAFLFARNHHQAMKHVVQARKEIGARTIFNILGPLCNPAKPRYQIIGTISESLAGNIAEALQKLGITKGLVICGAYGIDELTTCGTSIVFEVTKDEIKKYEFKASNLGIKAKVSDLEGYDYDNNANLFLQIFSGKKINHKIAQLICLNAGAAFYCINRTDSIKKGYDLAKQVLKSGAAWKKYLQFKKASLE
jgi:anthranilate phosphoribosyltransferase